MSKETEPQKPKAAQEEVETKNNSMPRTLKDEELDGVTGGTSVFADVPRVPSRDYNNEIKNKI